MSRSYKAPYWTDNGKGRKKAKKLANKRVRATELASGSAYKKASESWDINDFSFRDTSPKGSKMYKKARSK